MRQLSTYATPQEILIRLSALEHQVADLSALVATLVAVQEQAPAAPAAAKAVPPRVKRVS
jgi:hypothetical protein